VSFELIDHPSENIDHFILNSIAEIERAREDGQIVLVHCHQGISRSATLVTAYIAWKDGLSVMDALMYVKARRKIVSPNTGFIEQLKAFEKRLRISPDEAVRASLHYVTSHTDDDATYIVKQIFDSNRPLIDDSVIFLIHEGYGKNIYIREPKFTPDPMPMGAAVRLAGWMSKYEQAFKNASVVVVPYGDERFETILKSIQSLNGQDEVTVYEAASTSMLDD